MQFGRIDGTLESAIPVIQAGMLGDILERSPEIATARAALDRAELAIRAAKGERYPDLIVMGGARYNREHHELGGFHDGRIGWQAFVEAGITVPIFDRNQGGIATAEAELRAAQAELRALEIGIRSRFNVAFSRYSDAVRVSEAYRTEIIPRAEQAYRLYLEKYREMMAAYPQVLIARRTWLQANLDYVAALEDLVKAGVPLRGFLIAGAAPE
jgi:outer membrane protein, heavy metal efflux system